MIKKNLFTLGLISALSLSTVSCYDSSVDNDDTIEVLKPTYENTLTTESWRVSKYSVSNDSYNTIAFNSNVLKFEKDGSATITGDASVTTGTWEIINPTGNEDPTKMQLLMNFGAASPATGSWNILGVTAENIQLDTTIPLTAIKKNLEFSKVIVE